MSVARIELEFLSKQEKLEQQLQDLRESASRDKTSFLSKQESMNKKLQDAKTLELNLQRGRDSLQEQLFS